MSSNPTPSSDAASNSTSSITTTTTTNEAPSSASTSVIIDNRVSVIKRIPRAAAVAPAAEPEAVAAAAEPASFPSDCSAETPTPSTSTSAPKRSLESDDEANAAESSSSSSSSSAAKVPCPCKKIEYVSVVKTVNKVVDTEGIPCLKCGRCCASGELNSFSCGHVICKPCLEVKLQQPRDVQAEVPCDFCNDTELLDEQNKLPFLREVYF